MNIEYEEFESTEDLLMYLSSVAPPMKNFMPINSYKGFVCSFIPLSQSGGDLYLMLYAKGELETGIYEFDIKTRSIKFLNCLMFPGQFILCKKEKASSVNSR